MKVTKTVKVKIKSHNDIFLSTLAIYRDALGFIVEVVNREWENLSVLETAKLKCHHTEKLIHRTKENPTPAYPDFDERFYKFPSYFRRSAINEAIGIVSSYRSNLANHQLKVLEFEKEGKTLKDKAPRLSVKHYAFPVLYKGNMYQKVNEHQAMIKVFLHNDWVWITVDINHKDLTNRDLDTYKECSPSLVKSGRKFYLHIPFEKKVKLNTIKLEDKTIVAVDLGITNSAVCVAMKADGTIVDRLFINQPIEKDRMLHRLGRLKKAQQHSCQNSQNALPNHWRKINHLQQHIVLDTSSNIMAFAKKHHADVIVFEHLSKFKKTKKATTYAKRQRERLQFWAKMKVQNRVKEQAHRLGIRYSRVNPKNTSALAFDGSGQVLRNGKKDLCTFSTGKVYHSDLNASYNIGARYFIREHLKTFSEKRRSELLANVPVLQTRTKCTLASLISLVTAI